MDSKFKEIVRNLIQDRGRYWKPQEVETYLSQQEIIIDRNMMNILLESLVEDNIWR